jgi:hypothetical protein
MLILDFLTDYELLKEWATNHELFLMPQDEELLLADGKYLDDILNILDTLSIPDQKINLLLDALCVIVYDNSIDDSSEHDIELKNRVIKELNMRLRTKSSLCRSRHNKKNSKRS